MLCLPLPPKEEPAVERGITHQGHISCVDRINRPTEGFRCCKGGHWRSRCTISKDGCPASQVFSGQSVSRDEGRSPPAHQGSPVPEVMECARLVLCPTPCLMIGKEHLSIMLTCPTTGILTPRKVTIRRQLVVPSSSSDDDLPPVKHDARIDLNPGGVRIHYTQEHALMSNSPLSCPLLYIVLGQWAGV
jgi:hypothetical protein